jgi:DNA damage-binding protein 1
MLQDAITASRINTHKFPSSLILAASSGLIIGKVRDVDKMHIRSVRIIYLQFYPVDSLLVQIPFGLDIPERISHHPEFKVFAVACLRTEPVRIGDGDVLTSSLQLLDDTNFRRANGSTSYHLRI